jgi:hypothetical protein
MIPPFQHHVAFCAFSFWVSISTKTFDKRLNDNTIHELVWLIERKIVPSAE